MLAGAVRVPPRAPSGPARPRRSPRGRRDRSSGRGRRAPCPAPLQHTFGRLSMQGGATTASQRTGAETWRMSASTASAADRFGWRPRWPRPARAAPRRRGRLQLRREPRLRRRHQRAVERRADVQRHDSLRAERLGPFAGARDRVPMARDDDLPRRVQVGGRDDLGRSPLPRRRGRPPPRRRRESPPSPPRRPAPLPA